MSVCLYAVLSFNWILHCRTSSRHYMSVPMSVVWTYWCTMIPTKIILPQTGIRTEVNWQTWDTPMRMTGSFQKGQNTPAHWLFYGQERSANLSKRLVYKSATSRLEDYRKFSVGIDDLSTYNKTQNAGINR